MKIVHAADLHIDSPLRGLDRYEGAPADAVRGATRRAVENLMELCLEEGARLLLIAGDIFDGDWKDYSTGLFFARQLGRLREGGVEVVLIRGNHDAASQITRYLELPDNVFELSTKKPQTRLFDSLGVAVHGQGFAKRAVTEDLVAAYPDAASGYVNFGLLHTALSGRPGHDSYAPCSLETLRSKGYDYWALGHVHQREIVSDDPWIVFSGNLQGRHVRETGPKGATVVRVEEGRVVEVTHRALDVVRWCECTVEAAEAVSGHDVVDRVREQLEAALAEAGDRIVAARVRVTGRTPAHAALAADPVRWDTEIKNAALGAGPDMLWIESVRFETDPELDVAQLTERHDAIGQIARRLRALRSGEESMLDLLSDLDDLNKQLPAEVRQGAEALRLDDPSSMAGVLEDVERLLLPRLVELGDEE